MFKKVRNKECVSHGVKNIFYEGNHYACFRSVTGCITNDDCKRILSFDLEVIVITTYFGSRFHIYRNIQMG